MNSEINDGSETESFCPRYVLGQRIPEPYCLLRVATKAEFHGSGAGPVGFAGAAGACGAAALGGAPAAAALATAAGSPGFFAGTGSTEGGLSFPAESLGSPLGGGLGALVSSDMVAGEQTSGGTHSYKER